MITHTLGPWYTGEEEFSLTDPRCERPLEEFAPWNYEALFPETVSTGARFGKVRWLIFRELLKAADGLFSQSLGVLKEQVITGDTTRHRAFFKRRLREGLSVKSRPSMHTGKRFSEGIAAWDDEQSSFHKQSRETLLLRDPLRQHAAWVRRFSERVTAGENEYAVYKAAYKETVSLLEEQVRSMNGVLSEAIIREGEMTLDQFKDFSSSPIGYAPFVDFRVGDYEYKEALYRFTVEKKELSVNMALHDLVVHVDIPDTNDRGRAVIPAEVTKVYYNKHYYTPPEVVASVVGGTEETGLTIPFVLSTDKEDDKGRYFEILLKDANGRPAAGTVIWTAKGY